jgi:hypothetical protein
MDYSRFGAASPGPCPISASLFRMFFVKPPQNRHPERSASQIDRVIQRLRRGVEGPRRCLSYRCCSELFNHRARTGRGRSSLMRNALRPSEPVSLAFQQIHIRKYPAHFFRRDREALGHARHLRALSDPYFRYHQFCEFLCNLLESFFSRNPF